jgi:hypothetical protein
MCRSFRRPLTLWTTFETLWAMRRFGRFDNSALAITTLKFSNDSASFKRFTESLNQIIGIFRKSAHLRLLISADTISSDATSFK